MTIQIAKKTGQCEHHEGNGIYKRNILHQSTAVGSNDFEISWSMDY